MVLSEDWIFLRQSDEMQKKFLSFNDAERSFWARSTWTDGKMREPQLESIGRDRVLVQGDESRVSVTRRENWLRHFCRAVKGQ